MYSTARPGGARIGSITISPSAFLTRSKVVSITETRVDRSAIRTSPEPGSATTLPWVGLTKGCTSVTAEVGSRGDVEMSTALNPAGGYWEWSESICSMNADPTALRSCTTS